MAVDLRPEEIPMRVVLVEPDTDIADRLRLSLEADGHVVDTVDTLGDAEWLATRIHALTIRLGSTMQDPRPDVPPEDVEHWFG
jgi:hypothetical protein